MEKTNILLVDASADPTAGRPARPPRRILVVDDETTIRELVTDVLSRSGYQVDSAADGADAWDILKSQHYDLLVTDNSMPRVSGLELIKKVRDASLALPVIMATGTLPIEEFALHPALQPAATLLKPYSIMELLGKVETILRDADPVDRPQLLMRFDTADESKRPQTGDLVQASQPAPITALQRILVVERDSDLRLMYADVLTGPGLEVDAAVNPEAGWEALQSNRYNLLITENDLPRLSGIELVRKARSAGMDLPVIMAAETLPTYLLAHNPELEIAGTLRKPFVVDDLLAMVKSVLRLGVVIVLLHSGLATEIEAQDAKPASELPTPSPNLVTQPIAMTLSVVGKCEFSEDDITFKKLDRGHTVAQGAVIRTGDKSRIDLFFRRTGTTVRLQAGTEIRIEKMLVARSDGVSTVRTLLEIRAGRIFTVVRSAVAGSTLEIKNAAGRATMEGSGIGRYIITADGSHVSAKDSSIPLKVTGESGITIIAAGQQFAKKDGEMLPASPSLWVKDLIELDELQASTEE